MGLFVALDINVKGFYNLDTCMKWKHIYLYANRKIQSLYSSTVLYNINLWTAKQK